MGDVGFSCEIVLNAETALTKLLDDEGISILVSDHNLPGLSGVEMISRLQSSLPESRQLGIIFISGQAGTRDVIDALRLGVMEFFIKPIDPLALTEATAKVSGILALQRLETAFQEDIRQKVTDQTSAISMLNNKLEERDHALELAQRAKSEFLALISHELRTPLNIIIGFWQILGKAGEGNPKLEVSEASQLISDAGHNLLAIVNTIIELIDLRSGNLEVRKSPLDAGEVVKRVAKTFTPMANQHGVRIATRVDPEIPLLILDQSFLVQSLGHLLKNAIQFSSTNYEICVTAEVTESEVRLSVLDNGIGMSEEELEIAEEPFRQVDGSLSKSVYGLGLGLPMVRQMTEQQGGYLPICGRKGNGTKATLNFNKEKST